LNKKNVEIEKKKKTFIDPIVTMNLINNDQGSSANFPMFLVGKARRVRNLPKKVRKEHSRYLAR